MQNHERMRGHFKDFEKKDEERGIRCEVHRETCWPGVKGVTSTDLLSLI